MAAKTVYQMVVQWESRKVGLKGDGKVVLKERKKVYMLVDEWAAMLVGLKVLSMVVSSESKWVSQLVEKKVESLAVC